MGKLCLKIKNNTGDKKTTKNKNNNNNSTNGDSTKKGFFETSKTIYTVGKDIGSPLLTIAGVAGNQPETLV